MLNSIFALESSGLFSFLSCLNVAVGAILRRADEISEGDTFSKTEITGMHKS